MQERYLMMTAPDLARIGPGADRRGKLGALDAVRGIAALVVFNEHFFNSVTPAVGAALRPTPLFAMLNGAAAVMLFFVLSGFVLTIGPLRRGRAGALAGPVLRRWPRLAGPMVVAGVFYVLAARTGAFPKTAWLHGMGPQFPPALLWGQFMDDHDAGPVLWEAAFGVFLGEKPAHNIVLWTMIWELYGSFIVFAMALSLLLRLPRAVRIGLVLGLSALAFSISPWLVGFPFGVAAALFHVRFGERVRLPWGWGVVLLLLALPVLGWDFVHVAGMWAWTGRMVLAVRIYVWAASASVAAMAVMAVALYCVPVRLVLQSAPAQLLGAMSFPLYLTHVAVLFSVGTWLCFALYPRGVGVGGALLMYGPVLGASLLVAWPVMVFDRVWVRWLGWASGKVVLF